MELIWSTATFKPSNSKIWSASDVWFSNAMWYWKPEHPPPTTATRRAVETGLCIFMISLTLLAATGVRLIIMLWASTRGLAAKLSTKLSIAQTATSSSDCAKGISPDISNQISGKAGSPSKSRKATAEGRKTRQAGSLKMGCIYETYGYVVAWRRNL